MESVPVSDQRQRGHQGKDELRDLDGGEAYGDRRYKRH